MCFNTFVADLVRESNDAPKFHRLLLQSLENSDHFEESVFTHNAGEFLLAFVLESDDEGLI